MTKRYRAVLIPPIHDASTLRKTLLTQPFLSRNQPPNSHLEQRVITGICNYPNPEKQRKDRNLLGIRPSNKEAREPFPPIVLRLRSITIHRETAEIVYRGIDRTENSVIIAVWGSRSLRYRRKECTT